MRRVVLLMALVGGAPCAAEEPPLRADVVTDCYAAAVSPAGSSACIGDAANLCQTVRTEAFDGGTTIGISACLMAEHALWDAQLNESYQQLRRAYAAQDAEANGEHISRTEALRDAQRAWIAFRDAECRRQYAEFQMGTIRSTIHASCLMVMTAERAIELGRDIGG